MSELKAAQRREIEKAQPMWKIVLSQFAEHRLAVVGSFIVNFFILVAILAPFLSSWIGIGPDEQNVFYRFQPPMTELTASQETRRSRLLALRNEESLEKITEEVKTISQVRLLNPEDPLDYLISLDPDEALELLSSTNLTNGSKFMSMIKDFKQTHILGTDELGRDVLVRLIYGTRVSIGVGILVAVASALIGLIVGCLAGYYGGFLDAVLMRLTDALLSLPLLPVLIVVAAIDFQKVPVIKDLITQENQVIMKLVFILCLFSWMWVARLVRGAILSIKEREFILAAKTLGSRDTTIMLRHIIPNAIAPLLVAVTLGIGESILFEAALSFLGLGIQPPTPSWGNMLFNAQELIYEAPLLAILPGLLILFTTISFNYMGDGLQDAVDPKAIRR